MEFNKIMAIIQNGMLEKVETQLKKIGVPGISVTKVKGYGEYANFYAPDWKSTNARIEIYTPAEKVDEIVKTIIDIAHTGLPEDGIVIVSPVERFYHIQSKSETSAK